MDKTSIAIIGGGPSGIMAAIIASENGAKVCIYEKMEKLGKKLLISGRGRCNFTNKKIGIEHYHSTSSNFVSKSISQFDLNKTLIFFEKIGITYKSEKNGKIFPLSEQSSSILELLNAELKEKKVDIAVNTRITNIEKKGNTFILHLDSGQEVCAEKVILATGGKSYPDLGSTGDGYLLAEKLGHMIIPPQPALVQIKCIQKYIKKISGIKFNGSSILLINNQSIRKENGEILFTDYGLSGIPILQLSREINNAISKTKKVQICLDLFPAYNEAELFSLIQDKINNKPNRSIQQILLGLINSKLIPVILQQNKISDNSIKCAEISKGTLKKITHFIKNWVFNPIGTRSWDVAQITSGGISTKEINPETLMSKKVSKLYFAGEVIDVDGDSGGFNLQWAWTSGYVAGSHASTNYRDKQ